MSVTAALYLTIWVALALFAAGEAGRSGRRAVPAPWARSASLIGLLLASAHFLLAFDVRHDWSHASAVQETARQTADVYGLDWGGGVYVNYAFLGVWALDLCRWRAGARPGTARSRFPTWLVRAFYVVVILNAAVIFAAGWRRGLGAALVVAIVAAWWPRTQGRHPAGSPSGLPNAGRLEGRGARSTKPPRKE